MRKFTVSVNNRDFVFENDESGDYRALLELHEGQSITGKEMNILNEIAKLLKSITE